jgi:hypothetical protein
LNIYSLINVKALKNWNDKLFNLIIISGSSNMFLSKLFLKIKYLITHLGPKDLIYLKSLLMNCRNLKEIYLNSLNVRDKLLDIITKFSPNLSKASIEYSHFPLIDISFKDFLKVKGNESYFALT